MCNFSVIPEEAKTALLQTAMQWIPVFAGIRCARKIL
jgi:hypothetical protein